MSKKLDAIVACLDVIQQSHSEDASIVVLDTEKVIAQISGEKVKPAFAIGTPLTEMQGTVTWGAMQSGKVLREERDASVLGFPYMAIAVPLFEDGEVVGCVTTLLTQERLGTLRDGANELSALVEEMSASADEIAQASAQMAETIQGLAGESHTVSENITKIYSVLDFVKGVATQSHMLGLNAAIEAARAGEAGRGFSVVAGEIRKMAEKSKNAVQDIQQQLEAIVEAVSRMSQATQSMSSVTQEHAANIEELNSAFAHIATTAEKLASAAN
ncbi:MAG: histidine kinase [Alicyclobacillus herbarius]|uniref:methyl-accepting chemotaxis protein n=1 Tax=Alicyclobacillus herbarius TaxID=122960 RepID=UPI0004112CCD|nr:methyl-accepting chemotaxis protein [Alicyclobacillus herbarius]MCL6631159.1 histidine kinase [Alicyclobacillus herbarius]